MEKLALFCLIYILIGLVVAGMCENMEKKKCSTGLNMTVYVVIVIFWVFLVIKNCVFKQKSEEEK